MLSSYVLSRTLVPNMVHYLLGAEMKYYLMGEHGESAGGKGLMWAAHYKFNALFERMRGSYTGLLDWCLDHARLVLAGFALFSVGSLGLIHFIGSDFFPTVDSGQMRLHARAPSGTRIEETEVVFGNVEAEIRKIIPPSELETIIDVIGLPAGGSSLAYGDIPTIGVSDGEILISLKKDRKTTTPDYTRKLRKHLNETFPDVAFFFQAANITNQILNFGLPAPIDVQIATRNTEAAIKIARQLEAKIAAIPGAADVHIHQVLDYPEITVNVDREKAGQVGLTQRDVSNSMLISLSGSGGIAPTQWMNWQTGVNYQVAVQTPQRRVDSIDALLRTPIAPLTAFTSRTPDAAMGTAGANAASISAGPSQATSAYGNPATSNQAGGAQILANLAGTQRTVAPQIVNHYNSVPVYDVYANIDNQDLGSVTTAVQKIVDEITPKLPRGATLEVRGQAATMKSSFTRLGLGLIFAIILVYFLMALNFQSWLDPFIILTALPGALAGIIWILFVTQTTFSVPSLMGAIMCIGVATANSILVVVFANDQRLEGMNAREAALSAGSTRIRPVIMTASAMLIGMVPMALGLGEGGEQNSPLGRAVIGGLLFATITTLFVVPVVYKLMRRKAPVDFDQRIDEEERSDVSIYLNEGRNAEGQA
jgi:multidrug efflux pump subunit AcrB